MKLKKDCLFLVFLTILLIFVFPMTVRASEQDVYLALEEWELEGEMTIDMAQVIDENIDQIMEEELGQIVKEIIGTDTHLFEIIK